MVFVSIECGLFVLASPFLQRCRFPARVQGTSTHLHFYAVSADAANGWFGEAALRRSLTR